MDPYTGKSSVTVILPDNKITSGKSYPIVLDNKIGIATTPYIDTDNKGHLPEIRIK
jgi:hypothetical protein